MSFKNKPIYCNFSKTEPDVSFIIELLSLRSKTILLVNERTFAGVKLSLREILFEIHIK